MLGHHERESYDRSFGTFGDSAEADDFFHHFGAFSFIIHGTSQENFVCLAGTETPGLWRGSTENSSCRLLALLHFGCSHSSVAPQPLRPYWVRHQCFAFRAWDDAYTRWCAVRPKWCANWLAFLPSAHLNRQQNRCTWWTDSGRWRYSPGICWIQAVPTKTFISRQSSWCRSRLSYRWFGVSLFSKRDFRKWLCEIYWKTRFSGEIARATYWSQWNWSNHWQPVRGGCLCGCDR